MFPAEEYVIPVSNQKRADIVPLVKVRASADVSGGHWTRPVMTARIGDREAPPHGWSKCAQVLLIEGNEKASPGLTLALARAGHIVCRVQDAHASMIVAAKTLFDVGVIDMNRNSELDIDLAELVRSLRSAQRGLPIILVGSELTGNDRQQLEGADGVWLLAKASAQANLLEAVFAAIAYGGRQTLASEGVNSYCSTSHRDQVEISAKG